MAPKITLYTNHGCPFAQRAHITLNELKLAYDEVIIDLATPRPQWYLDINPRGLVPAIKYSDPSRGFDEITLTESAVVVQFLTDAHPSHLLPSSAQPDPTVALARARLAFFTDTWATKVGGAQLAVTRADSAAEKDAKAAELVAVLRKEIEPLLADAGPFFGGSKELTTAEVFAAPFVQRLLALSEDGELVPAGLKAEVERLPNFGRWIGEVLRRESVAGTFEKSAFVEAYTRKLKQMREAQK